jgi:modulator of FtsH protease HflC
LRRRIDDQALRVYGITIRQVGLERLTLPSATLTATIDRMRAERATVAAQRCRRRLASGGANPVRRRSRFPGSRGTGQGVDVAEHRGKIAYRGGGSIYKNAYAADPPLYTMLRSLDSLSTIRRNANTTLILRTDAAPFHALVENAGGSDAAGAGKGK